MRRALLTVLPLLATAVLGAAEPTPPAPAERPRLGVTIEDAFDPSQGVPVRAVTPGSTAAALGVQSGDAIRAVNGKPVANAADLQAAIGGLTVGATLAIDVTRQGRPTQLTGTVLAPLAAANLSSELAEAQREIERLKGAVDAKTREPTLAELIRELQLLQAAFPKAAAEFKKIYPNGEFAIVIRIVSDKNAPDAVDLMKDPKALLPGDSAGGASRPPEPAPGPAPK